MEVFNSSQLFVFLFRYRKTLIIVFLLSVILSILFSSPWFITPKYKSEIVMYPASTNSISKSLLTERQTAEQDVLEYGEEAATEQMLQLLSSGRIRNRIVKKFDLFHHYDIDPDSKYRYTELIKTYQNNIRFSRTEYMAVKVSVLDTDPQMAADIANEIGNLVDSVKNEIAHQRAMKAFEIVKAEYNQLLSEIQQMEDSLTAIRQKGVQDYESQVEMFNQQLAKEVAANNWRGVNALEKKLEVMALYGSAYLGLTQQLEFEREKLSLLKRKYEEAKVDATEMLPQKFIVDKAYKSEKKAYPVRWLIVVVSVLSALLFTVIVLISLDGIRRVSGSSLRPN